ncbi:PadR family transcriptional regulator AphA [Alkalihalobacillus xiaoxiensis]|uniref:PadR family transcriptional regulator AphA n=1 Tax=Shouchella xiaoxiensis TaxID=766895 RepID=A0ABS2SUM0_9BACI|nr:PadR family transcriptional regulator [Shouchella xiaoxiensis]MBM7839230.1 PadR family transcriptional regulator AphA [Shouchella xiaoxiensis]
MSLRHGLLGLLSDWEASGYDIKQEFDGFVSVFWHSNLSQIYPELTKLEQDGFIKSRLIEQTGKPDKKLYTITNDGKSELVKWLSKPSTLPKRKDAFLMQSFFMDQLSADETIFQLQTFQKQQQEKLTAMNAFLAESLASIRERRQVKKRVLIASAVYAHAIQQEKLYLEWAEQTQRLIEQARPLWETGEMDYELFEQLLVSVHNSF